MAERNKIKLKKTRGGAQQYGSTEDFQKHYDRLFNKFINDGSASDSDILEKMNRLKAGKYATRSYDEDGSFEKQQMEFAEEKAKQRRKRPVNKKYGGKVTKMKEGGKVPSKYKGFSKLPESVQRQMDSGLAEKYEYGGKVGGCRGGGAAIKGTKFTGCK